MRAAFDGGDRADLTGSASNTRWRLRLEPNCPNAITNIWNTSSSDRDGGNSRTTTSWARVMSWPHGKARRRQASP